MSEPREFPCHAGTCGPGKTCGENGSPLGEALAASSLLIFFILCTVSPALAGTYSSVQSTARPFGLDIVDKVQIVGSDTRAASFQTSYLPTMQQWGTMDLTSPSFTQLTSTVAIDPSKIKLANQYDTRVYFIGDNTSKHNSLGFNTGGGGITTGNPKLIFPDASQSNSSIKIPFTKIKIPYRTSKEPLLPGDFVDLGTQASGTQLDFFLISQRTSNITDVFSTQTSLNPDMLQHAIVYARPDSPYLFIGFEDLYNTNSPNYKDVLYAVDIGVANVNSLTSMPEPSTMLILGTFLGFVVYRKYSFDLEHARNMT